MGLTSAARKMQRAISAVPGNQKEIWMLDLDSHRFLGNDLFGKGGAITSTFKSSRLGLIFLPSFVESGK